ncbi:MAG: hypothetical protein QMD96_02310 [Anaerosomatales bacterium]|nr:hypothetical protein [Anaerosomatales bacterium]
MTPLPPPPESRPEAKRLPALVPVGLITASTALLLIAAALVLGIFGVPIERGLATSERVQIHGTDLVVTVPENWSGTETRYFPLSAQRNDPSALFSQEVWLTSGSWAVQIFVHKDPDELQKVASRLDRDDSIFEPLSLDGTPFEPASWRAWSAESTAVCSVMLIGRQEDAYPKVQVLVIARQEGSTTKPSGLLDVLDGIVRP